MRADEVAGAVSEAFGSLVVSRLRASDQFTCAVPGGSVATRVFPRLATLTLPWDRVHVFLADERVVPPDHPDSNTRLVKTEWIDRVPGEPPQFHAIDTSGPLDVVVSRAENDLQQVCGRPPRLDLIMLGVGPDGHVASLFPGHPALVRRDAWVVAITDAPKPPPVRVSLGIATMEVAREIWFVAFGRDKAPVIAEAQKNPHSTLPVAIVARCGPPVRWFLDDDAASAP